LIQPRFVTSDGTSFDRAPGFLTDYLRKRPDLDTEVVHEETLNGGYKATHVRLTASEDKTFLWCLREEQRSCFVTGVESVVTVLVEREGSPATVLDVFAPPDRATETARKLTQTLIL
jgi:hypothetical protein